MPTPNESGADAPLIKRRSWSAWLIWLVPVIAVLLGASVAIRSWMSSGPRIQISFETAEGLEAGKTQVRYKNVVIGEVGSIELSEDRSRVIVDVSLKASASAFATANTRFWVVRPRIGSGGISGIDTVLSGAFIGADPAGSNTEQKTFLGLETPPPVTHGEAGRQFLLHTDDLGSLDIGSPVYYRRIQVGRVAGVKLGDDGRRIDVTIFITAPNDHLVTRATRFWNASGLDVSLSAAGLKVNTQSLATVIGGGIAFQSPANADTTPAPADTTFNLVADEATAMAPPDGEPVEVSMRFRQSIRGLAVNAPVEFKGVDVGRITSMDLDYDPQTMNFSTIVSAVLYPERMGLAYSKLATSMGVPTKSGGRSVVESMIRKGLRAQARSGNLLTGQLYVAIDYLSDPARASVKSEGELEIPTVAGKLDQLQDQVASIAERVAKIPFDSIGQKLDASLGSLDSTLKRVQDELIPGLQTTLLGAQEALGAARDTLNSVDKLVSDDSAARVNLDRTLQELQRSARSVRDLTDYLGRHPEALIRGRRKSESDVSTPVETNRETP